MLPESNPRIRRDGLGVRPAPKMRRAPVLSRFRSEDCFGSIAEVAHLDLGLELNRTEQGLSFRDLWEFHSGRETFERRREHHMGIGGAVRRMIKLRQRERRAQLKAPRLLLLRDG